MPVATMKMLVRCDPKTGLLYWLPRSLELFELSYADRAWSLAGRKNNWNAKFQGKQAFNISHKGYRRAKILGKWYLAHRVVWALVNGEWPKLHIDHFNQDRADNRLTNLREVTSSKNQSNRRRDTSGSSKYVGVKKSKTAGKWEARFQRQGFYKHLGTYRTEEEAALAYDIFAMAHGDIDVKNLNFP